MRESEIQVVPASSILIQIGRQQRSRSNLYPFQREFRLGFVTFDQVFEKGLGDGRFLSSLVFLHAGTVAEGKARVEAAEREERIYEPGK